MDFNEILIKVLFLVGLALFGLFIGRTIEIKAKDLSELLIYFISPAVIFISVLEAPADDSYFFYLVGAFFLCSAMSLIALFLARLMWRDNTEYLFAFAGGTGNTGYFALPIAISLFDAAGAAISVFIIIGVNLYEFTVGYFLASRGQATVKQSLLKILKLPTVYAFAFALLLRWLNVDFNPAFIDSMSSFKGAYSILGMLVIGLTLSTMNLFKIDFKYISLSLAWKFVAWPVIGLIVVNLFSADIDLVAKSVILLMCSVPMAGNVVIISNNLGVHPEKAATAVMVSTLLAILSVPIVMTFL